MQNNISTVEAYIRALPDNRKDVIKKLRKTIVSSLPDGFDEQITYGMISYVVPLSRYPQGYHVKKNEPLPFISIASQKNHVALYHMGLYSDKEMVDWFTCEYAKQVPSKLDMGKSCIRFKNMKQIPYDLISELCKKMTADAYISLYEQTIKKR